MASYKVGILGATGAVGEQMRIVLAERKFPISELRLFGSARSAGKVINYEGQDIVVQEASLEAFKGLDLLLGAAAGHESREDGHPRRGQLQRLPP